MSQFHSNNPHRINAVLNRIAEKIHDAAERIINEDEMDIHLIDDIIDNDFVDEIIPELIKQINYLGQLREKLRREEYGK